MKCGEVITTINPFHRRTNQAKWAFEKNVLYIHADREGVWYAAHFLTVFDGEHKRLT